MIPFGIAASARRAAPGGLMNHVVIAAPGNGTATHTVNPNGTGGTVVAGTAFTPTAGRLLLCVAEGAVTSTGTSGGGGSTAPSGWSGGAATSGYNAVNYSGLYLWYKTAAGSDSVTAYHNGSNYAVAFEFIEYSAGSTVLGSASAVGVSASGGAGPSLTGLTGTYDAYAAIGQTVSSASGSYSVSWSAGTKILDTFKLNASSIDGYLLSTANIQNRTGASWSSTATSTYTVTTAERLVWAIRV